MTRPSSTKSPRSVMRTTTDRLFRRLTTRTIVPNGRVGWQAVMAYISNVSPLAVFRPLKTEPYQDAMPRSNFRRLLATGDGFVDGAARFGVAFATSGLAVAAGLGTTASARTVRVDMVPNSPVIATHEVPTSSQNCIGVWGFTLRAFGRLSIFPFY